MRPPARLTSSVPPQTHIELLGRGLEIDAANSGAAGAAMAARPVEGCWFCLSNPSADVDLVASVGEESYLALDKGAITDLHTLLLPVEHYASMLALPASTWAEMERCAGPPRRVGEDGWGPSPAAAAAANSCCCQLIHPPPRFMRCAQVPGRAAQLLLCLWQSSRGV